MDFLEFGVWTSLAGLCVFLAGVGIFFGGFYWLRRSRFEKRTDDSH